MTLTILKYPDPLLKEKSKPVDKISKEIIELTDDMIETMFNNDGLGLAANQVGSLHRIFVLNSAPSGETPKPMVFINPEILGQNGQVVGEEGCLSFPDLYITITRPDSVVLQAKNLYNETVVFKATGLLARAVMHEVDHLDGIVFIERVDQQDVEKVKEYLRILPKVSEGT